MPPASTWFDLVVRLDLHYEVVPGSPSPVPFPHAFIATIFDPMSALVEEMLSATGPVLINGRMATVTGDEAKMPKRRLG